MQRASMACSCTYKNSTGDKEIFEKKVRSSRVLTQFKLSGSLARTWTQRKENLYLPGCPYVYVGIYLVKVSLKSLSTTCSILTQECTKRYDHT